MIHYVLPRVLRVSRTSLVVTGPSLVRGRRSLPRRDVPLHLEKLFSTKSILDEDVSEGLLRPEHAVISTFDLLSIGSKEA